MEKKVEKPSKKEENRKSVSYKCVLPQQPKVPPRPKKSIKNK